VIATRLKDVSVVLAGGVVGAVLLAGCGSGKPSAPIPPARPDASARTLQYRFVAAVKNVSPSVVEVVTPRALGSGFVIDGKGDIVTNHHVVSGYTRFKVVESSGRAYSATLVGSFAPDDLAVIRVTGAHLKPLKFALSSRLHVGDLVLAIGNPLGLKSSVTEGIVSALGRTVTEENGTALADVIQTSAPINPGNSGGALVDLSGKVVGIPTLEAVDTQNAQIANGIGFAIPSDTIRAIAAQLVQYGRVVNSGRAYLGVRLVTTVSGAVVVTDVVSGGPARSAGIGNGDTIVGVHGRHVSSVDDVASALSHLRPGTTTAVSIRRADGRKRVLDVKLGAYPGG
jgi:putative serine protease PepD